MPMPGNCFTDDLFGAAVGVDIGGVDEIDPLIPGFVDDAQRILCAGLLAKHHRAEGEGGHL
ncbi:hypothetical protein D3C72_1942670 [compost metagenome]